MDEDSKIRMSLHLDDLPSKAKQGIKIMSHRQKMNGSDLIEKKFEHYKP